METPKRLTDRKREAIIQAAVAEFREFGFQGTSMDRVAARAEVSKRTVYNHFPSKDELFAATLFELWQTSTAKLDIVYNPDRPLREQLIDLLRRKMAALTNGSFIDLARVAVAEMIHSPQRAQEMIVRLCETEHSVENWITRAQQDGRLKVADPAFATQQLMGLLEAFAFWPQIAMGQPQPEAAEQDRITVSAVDMFLAYYAQA